MSTVAVEVVYRGIFQKTLARNIVRSIVFAARKEGKYGTAFGRYGDSPERNGIPPSSSPSSPTTRRNWKRTWQFTKPRKWTLPSTWTTPCARASSPGPGTAFSPSTP